MIQALIATLVELVSLMFAMAAGAFLEEAKLKDVNRKALVCIILSLVMAACALGVAAR